MKADKPVGFIQHGAILQQKTEEKCNYLGGMSDRVAVNKF
jgi:hypothetical protein